MSDWDKWPRTWVHCSPVGVYVGTTPGFLRVIADTDLLRIELRSLKAAAERAKQSFLKMNTS